MWWGISRPHLPNVQMGFFGADLTNLRGVGTQANEAYQKYLFESGLAREGSRQAAEDLKKRMAGTEFLANAQLQDLTDYYAGREFAGPSATQSAAFKTALGQSRFAGGLGNAAMMDTTGRKFVQQQKTSNRKLAEAFGQTAAAAREQRAGAAFENYGKTTTGLAAADAAMFNYRFGNPMSYAANALNLTTPLAGIYSNIGNLENQRAANIMGLITGAGSTAAGAFVPTG